MKLPKRTLIELESYQILQINATIIAGALIFLTFTSQIGNSPITYTTVAIAIIGVLSVSTVYTLTGDKIRGTSWMMMGFIFLIFLGLVLFAGNLYRIFQGAYENPILSSFNSTVTNQSGTNQSNPDTQSINITQA